MNDGCDITDTWTSPVHAEGLGSQPDLANTRPAYALALVKNRANLQHLIYLLLLCLNQILLLKGGQMLSTGNPLTTPLNVLI